MHCRGAVLDFIKLGSFEDGFLRASEPNHLRKRVEIFSDESGEPIPLEEVVALFGVHNEFQSGKKRIEPRWHILSRLAILDEELHIVAKVLLGFKQEEIAEQVSRARRKSLTRERISQKIYEFFERLDNSEFYDDPFCCQAIYALGMNEIFHQPEVDNGYGENLPSMDLNSPDSFVEVKRYREMTTQTCAVKSRQRLNRAVGQKLSSNS